MASGSLIHKRMAMSAFPKARSGGQRSAPSRRTGALVRLRSWIRATVLSTSSAIGIDARENQSGPGVSPADRHRLGLLLAVRPTLRRSGLAKKARLGATCAQKGWPRGDTTWIATARLEFQDRFCRWTPFGV